MANLFWTAVAALAATASAGIAAYYTRLTFLLVRAQNEPNVVMYVRHDDSRPSILQIVIENIGRGLATDMFFHPSRAIPRRAFKTTETAEVMTEGPLVDGIRSLGPGDSRRIAWGCYEALRNALGDEPLTVKYEYRHGDRSIGPVEAVLDINSFIDTDAVGSDGERVTKQLERMADVLEKILERLPAP